MNELILSTDFDELLKQLNLELKKVENEIKDLPEGRLAITQLGAKKYDQYLHMFKEDGKYIRKSIKKDEEAIAKLLRKAFLEKKVEILKQDIKIVNKFTTTYSDSTNNNSTANSAAKSSPNYRYKPVKYIVPTLENIVSLLPDKYTDFGLEPFFDTFDVNGFGNNHDNNYDNNCENNYSNNYSDQYKQSKYLSEGKTISTSRGLKVRSKSEALIAEMFYEYNIDFHYEEVFRAVNGDIYIPDFTIRRHDGKIYYWEHCGMTSDSSYMKKHKKKIDEYEKWGIVPWKNLIISYDDENGNIDLRIIKAEIMSKLL